MKDENNLPALDKLSARLLAAEILIDVLLKREADASPGFKEALDDMLEKSRIIPADITSPALRQFREEVSEALASALENVQKSSAP